MCLTAYYLLLRESLLLYCQSYDTKCILDPILALKMDKISATIIDID